MIYSIDTYHYNLFPQPDRGYAVIEGSNPSFPMSRRGDYVSGSACMELARKFCTQGEQLTASFVALENTETKHTSDVELLVGYDANESPLRISLLNRDDLNRGDRHCVYLPDYLVPEKEYMIQKAVYTEQYSKICAPKHLSGRTGYHDEIPVSVSIWWFQNQLLHLLFEIDGKTYEVSTKQPIISFIQSAGYTTILQEILETLP